MGGAITAFLGSLAMGFLGAWFFFFCLVNSGRVGMAFLALFGIDFSVAFQGSGQSAKAKLSKGLKSLVQKGSWTGWLAVNLFDTALNLAEWIGGAKAPSSKLSVGYCILVRALVNSYPSS